MENCVENFRVEECRGGFSDPTLFIISKFSFVSPLGTTDAFAHRFSESTILQFIDVTWRFSNGLKSCHILAFNYTKLFDSVGFVIEISDIN